VSGACVHGFLAIGPATKHGPVATGGDRYGDSVRRPRARQDGSNPRDGEWGF